MNEVDLIEESGIFGGGSLKWFFISNCQMYGKPSYQEVPGEKEMDTRK